jgi:hypothetical protein
MLVATSVAACSPVDGTPDDQPDTDGDGLSDRDELQLYGTSPLQTDTDGDGFSDFSEIVSHAFDPANDPYEFNPRVADLPRIAIEMTSAPEIVIVTTETDGETRTFETSRADDNTFARTDGTDYSELISNSLSTPVTVTHEVAVGTVVRGDAGTDGRGDGGDGGSPADAGDAGTDAGEDAGEGASDDGGGGTAVTARDAISQTYDPSSTAETSVTFSEAQMQQFSETLTATEAYAESSSVSRISGAFKVTLRIVNDGHIGYRINSILLTSYLSTDDDPAYPIGNMSLDSPLTTFAPFSVPPRTRTAPLNFVRDVLSLETTEILLRESRALTIRLGAYELADLDGKPFDARATEIASKTAVVEIDFGTRRPRERWLVATNLEPGLPGVTARRALEDVLRIPIDADERGLYAVRGIGSRTSRPAWIGELRHDDGATVVATPYDEAAEPYDLRSIRLRAGDVLHLAYVDG